MLFNSSIGKVVLKGSTRTIKDILISTEGKREREIES